MSRGHGAVPAAVIVGIVLLAIAVRPAACSGQPFDFSGVEAAATDAVASGEIPGVVVLVGRGDEVLLHRAWGSRAVVPHPLPMLPDTIFDVASLTKPFGTTLAVMSLVEHGKIALDAPLSRYLGEFRAASFSRVTIRRMLTHTAGFPAIPGNGALASGFPKAAKLLAAKAPDYAPGTAFQYSDTGFILLAEVVRRVSGEPIDRYLQRTVFDVYIDPALISYSVTLADATRNPAAHGLDELAAYVSYGASPRGPISLVQAARALALLRGRDYVLVEDLHALAADALRHRLVLSYQALAEEVSPDTILERVVAAVPVPQLDLAETSAA